MNTSIISAAITYFVWVAIGFGTAWQIQSWRNLENENHRIAEQAAAQQEISRMEQARSAQVIAAANSARSRESKLRMDASAAQSNANSLRSATDAAVRDAQSDPNACPDKAQSLAVVFAECRGALVQMAADADEWHSEYQLIAESWPK